MLKLIEQNQLIEQNGTQHNQLGAPQTFDRDLTSPFKHIFEQAIERLNGLVTQLVEYLAHLWAPESVRGYGPRPEATSRRWWSSHCS